MGKFNILQSDENVTIINTRSDENVTKQKEEHKMTTNNNLFKQCALIRFLYEEEKEIFEPLPTIVIDGNRFELSDGREYLVLTEEDVNDMAGKYIKDSLWAFNADFIMSTCGLNTNKKVCESLQRMQAETCEWCNDFILALIEGTCGLDDFIQEAIFADGRGHFLSMYDGEEHEINIGSETYYIYRTD